MADPEDIGSLLLLGVGCDLVSSRDHIVSKLL